MSKMLFNWVEQSELNLPIT